MNTSVAYRLEALEKFMEAVAKMVGCLPSYCDSHPDRGNAHIIERLRLLTSQSSGCSSAWTCPNCGHPQALLYENPLKKGNITMRKIILHRKDSDTIPFAEISHYSPIFAKKDGEFRGMVVKEDDGWIIRIGGSAGATGHHKTLRECLVDSLAYGYEFFT